MAGRTDFSGQRITQVSWRKGKLRRSKLESRSLWKVYGDFYSYHTCWEKQENLTQNGSRGMALCSAIQHRQWDRTLSTSRVECCPLSMMRNNGEAPSAGLPAACCDSCDAPSTLQHTLKCKMGGLVVIFCNHNEIRDELVTPC